MKTKISRLARGIFEENNMELYASVSTLTGECVTDGFVNGSFTIMASVSAASDKELRGIVCSNNSHRIIIQNETFTGPQTVINYRVNAVGLAAGEKVSGTVSVVSNCGEFSMPCEFDVVEAYIQTSIGRISNMFHFANLAQQSFDEALTIFAGESFERIFIKDDLKLQAVYEGLVHGSDIKNALEEFLIFANKKKRITYSFQMPEAEKYYENVSANFTDKLVIRKHGWGYGSFEILVTGDFIITDKSLITTDEFAGNNYELSYLIDYSRLHAGNNYGRITISAYGVLLTYDITVAVHQCLKNPVDKIRAAKINILELTNKYFEFRMKKISTDSWAKQSLELVDALSEDDCANDFIKLLRAQILIAERKPEAAVRFINEAGAHLRAGKKKQEFLYCYYLYVRTLYSKNVTVTKDAIEEIEEFYKKSRDIRIMWILLYLDEEYLVNKSLRLARIKEQFARNARSPFFYYEACAVFSEQPGLLRVLNSFEIQAVWWGCRNNMINIKLAEQFVRLVSAERTFNPVLFSSLAYICDKFNKTEFLEVLCRYVVGNTPVDKKYFKWYEKGVVEGFEFDGLYEAYINTLEHTDKAVPDNVVLYFAYNGELEADKKAFLFANLLKNETQYSGIIKNYVAQIKAFAVTQLNRGYISEELAYIYKRVLGKNDVNESNAANVVKTHLTMMITCSKELSERFLAVIIRYKEFDKELRCELKDGVAYFEEYSDDAAILFEDVHGNRYVAEHGAYECRNLINQTALLRKGIELVGESTEVSLYLIEKKAGHYNKNVTVLYENIISSDYVKTEYRNYIYRRLIDYYSDNGDEERLVFYLKNADIDSFKPSERTKVTELFLIQGLYKEGYEIIKKHGYDNISTNRLMRLCTIRLKEQDMQEDAFFTCLCTYVFNHSKYGEAILSYLMKFYVGSTRELFRLWRVSRDFGADTKDMEGRLIVQMLFTEVYLAGSMEVFEEYYKKCRTDMVTMAYLNNRTYLYLVQDMVIDEKNFEFLERECAGGYELSDIGKLALLKYYSEKEVLGEKALKLAEKFLTEMYKKGYVFAFYNKFADKFILPFEIRDKLILEYKTAKGRYVELKYMFDSDEAAEDSYHTEVMKECFEGTYVRPFVIFYGEKIKYYIAENEGREACLTESGTREMLSLNMEGEPGCYGMLNDICSARELKDEQTLIEAMKEYERKLKLVEDIFLPFVEE